MSGSREIDAGSTSAPGTAAAFDRIEARIDAIIGGVAGVRPKGMTPSADVTELLGLGEAVLELWIGARGETPTVEAREGFRLLALHRQGARGEPSFNACRETCRELVYHYNLVTLEPEHPDAGRRVVLAALIAKHLCLFVSAKMQAAGIGEFCCAAKPMRVGEDV